MKELTLLIADDEQIERQTMAQFIVENFPQIRRVETAENGFELVAKAEECRPDILLVDVKMPGMNGLDGIGLLHKKGIRSRTIIYSAYNHFNYAQEAILLDVDAYLLKPARRFEIVKILNEMVELALEDRQQSNHPSQANQLAAVSPLLQTEFIRSIILDDLDSDTMSVCLSLLLVPFAGGCVITFDLGEARLSATDLRTVFQQQEPRSTRTIIGPLIHGQCTLYLSFEPQQADEQLHNRCTEWIASVVDRFARLYQVTVRAGLGTPCGHLSDLPGSYRRSLTELRSRAEPDTAVRDPFARDDAVLQNLVLDGANGKAAGHLRRLFGELGASTALVTTVQPMVRDFVLRCWQTVKTLTNTERSIQTVLDFPLETSDQMTTLTELCQWTCRTVEKLIDVLKQEKIVSGASYIRAARLYIEKNYAAQLNLDEVADFLGISPFYLSHLFKKETDMTFLQYVTNCRMHQASRIHLETGLPLDQVAERVGYKDSAYFKRRFAHFTSRAP